MAGVGWGECASPSDPYLLPGDHRDLLAYPPRFPGARWSWGETWSTIEELTGCYRLVKGNDFRPGGPGDGLLGCCSPGARDNRCTRCSGGTRREILSGVSLGIEADASPCLTGSTSYLAEGYRRIKLKIAPGRDVDVVRRVRERYPEFRFRSTPTRPTRWTTSPRSRSSTPSTCCLSNSRWPTTTSSITPGFRPSLQTPICLDESIHSADDARKALDLGACRVINIKVSRLGGLLEARRVHDVCLARGVPVWCGGMHEFGIGRAANVAIASLPGFTLPGDVSGSDKYYRRRHRRSADPGHPAAPSRCPTAPGLGVEPVEEDIARHTLAHATIRCREQLRWTSTC